MLDAGSVSGLGGPSRRKQRLARGVLRHWIELQLEEVQEEKRMKSRFHDTPDLRREER